jgi:UTP--glucose-1-phosphate uridylyltransferase
MEKNRLEIAVVPVAGLGTRMLPATKSIPKEMLPIVDKPVIQYVVEEIFEAGFTKIIFVTHPSKKVIGRHFDKSSKFEKALAKRIKKSQLKELENISNKKLDLKYINQNKALGLGHAIKCAQTEIGKKPFAVVLPDRVVDGSKSMLKKSNLAKLRKYFLKTNLNCMLLNEVPKNEVNKFGIIKPRNKNKKSVMDIEDIIEKPNKSDAPSNLAAVGRYIFTPDIFKYIPSSPKNNSKEIELTHAIQFMIFDGFHLSGLLADSRYFDCGDKLGYFESFISFALKDKELGKRYKKIIKTFI